MPIVITDEDAIRAGHPNAASVRKRLSGEESWMVYRIGLAWAGEDPRIALRSEGGRESSSSSAPSAQPDSGAALASPGRSSRSSTPSRAAVARSTAPRRIDISRTLRAIP